MTRAPFVLAAVGLIGLAGCAAPSQTTPARSPVLPLRALRLYETGVGYFERSGTLDGGGAAGPAASLPVPAGHLDDALKTLVVLSAGGRGPANVQGFEFGSSVSRGMARALAGLPLDAEQPVTFRDLLVSVKGAPVEIRTRSATLRGRVIDVVGTYDPGAGDGDAKKTEDKPATREPRVTVLLLRDGGELVRVAITDVEGVKPLDPTYAARFGAALDALAGRGARTVHSLTLVSGGGPVTLGYIAETPIWRTSYRLVLDSAGPEPAQAPARGVLQAWALVHNDTDEDWDGVRLELVNGRPDSFLFPLAAPRYGRRDLAHPENELSTVPQLLGTTADALWGDHVDEAHGAGGLGLSGYGMGGGGSGHGVGLGSIGTIGHGAGTGGGASESALLGVGNLASLAEAQGVEAGALFAYGMPAPLRLRAHGSALVPFLSRPIDAEPITWLSGPGAKARAAVRLTNSTPQTLPVGTIALFGAAGFLGEAALDRLKPGERRFVQHGADLDVELTETAATAQEEPKRLVFSRGALHEHFLRTTRHTFAVENRGGQPRTVYLVLALANNAKVTGADRLDYDVTDGRPLAVFRADGRKKSERVMTSVEGLSRAVDAGDVQRLLDLSTSDSLSAAEKSAAAEAASRAQEAADAAKRAEADGAELSTLEKDIERWRGHLKALTVAPQTGPFVQRILNGEDRLLALRKRIDEANTQVKAKRKAALAALAKLPDR